MTKYRVLLLGVAIATAGFCGTVTEVEADGSSTNNTLATAQTIPDAAFTSPAPAGVFSPSLSAVIINGLGGGQDVDFYSFTASGDLELSITDTPFTFPTILSLYDSSGNLLAFDDSSTPAKPGSASTLDSYIGSYTLSSVAATYYVAVSNAGASIPNYPDTSSCTGFDTLTRPDGGFGGITTSGCDSTSSVFGFAGSQPATGSSLAYTLVIGQGTLASATPEPGTLGLLALGCVALISWKLRASRSEVQ